MTLEDALKNHILTNHRSLRSFAQTAGINYQTLMSIFSRGIDKASISNIIKLCQTLGISSDALAEGRIEKAETKKEPASVSLEELIEQVRNSLKSQNVTLDGKTIDREDIDLIINSQNVVLELIRRKRNEG